MTDSATFGSMYLRLLFLSLAFVISGRLCAQNAELVPVVDFDGLEAYIAEQDEDVIVVNFWATWCLPCVEELHYFEYAHRDYKDKGVKVILASLDFKAALESSLMRYIKDNDLQSDVVLLSDPKMSSWIEKVSPEWSGAIPATWVIAGDKQDFFEGKFASYEDLKKMINRLKN